MSTKRVVIEGGEHLEGVLREGQGRGGVVICHPHPLYGGSMWNNVVDALEEGFSQTGLTTLKFNFRGVGASTGRHDEGAGETGDVAAACLYLQAHTGGRARLVLAGYSFGAWVCAKAVSGIMRDLARDVELCLVAYPFSVYRDDELRAFRGKTCLVGGSRDEISPLDALLALYKVLPGEKSLKVVPSSHTFDGQEPEITAFIRETFGKREG